ncbi:hypothetical protein KI387_005207, partial [Taxus chinensis]
KNRENWLSPSPRRSWDSWDIEAWIGRKASRRPAKQRDIHKDIRAVGRVKGVNWPVRPKRRTFALRQLGHLGREDMKD